MAVAARRRWRAMKGRLAFWSFALVGLCLWCWGSGYDDVRTIHRSAGISHHDSPTGGARRLFVDDYFTLGERRSGAVVLHCLGLLYSFVAIAIVCDECFVPSLEVITEVLELSPDVAGATFMAAGGSAPEFFTSLIGSILVESDIGTGTIIGSAVFNVLFVIGACAVMAPDPLQLTAFPLARDCMFYFVDLVVVTCTFIDEEVQWWEALMLFLLYVAYAAFMKHSGCVEELLKGRMRGPERATPDGDRWAASCGAPLEAMQDKASDRSGSPTSPPASPGRHSGSSANTSADGRQKSAFRHRSVRVTSHMTARHTDTEEFQTPMTEDSEKDGRSSGCASRDLANLDFGSQTADAIVPMPFCGTTPADRDLEGNHTTAAVPPAPEGPDPVALPVSMFGELELDSVIPPGDLGGTPDAKTRESRGSAESARTVPDEKMNEALNLSPPPKDASLKDWAGYVLTLPILVCLVSTVPDVRRPGCRRYFVLTFSVSIFWIGVFTWAMVWFATVISETCGMDDHVMGLTILAAGTSVPDLLTSVIVARQGQGDMAISSSIGSNIFDVTVGLPVPWLLYAALHNGKPIAIKNESLEISVLMLLAMLGITIGTIMCHNWVMTKMMGLSLLTLYLLFTVLSVGLTFAPPGSLKLIKV